MIITPAHLSVESKGLVEPLEKSVANAETSIRTSLATLTTGIHYYSSLFSVFLSP